MWRRKASVSRASSHSSFSRNTRSAGLPQGGRRPAEGRTHCLSSSASTSGMLSREGSRQAGALPSRKSWGRSVLPSSPEQRVSRGCRLVCQGLQDPLPVPPPLYQRRLLFPALRPLPSPCPAPRLGRPPPWAGLSCSRPSVVEQEGQQGVCGEVAMEGGHPGGRRPRRGALLQQQTQQPRLKLGRGQDRLPAVRSEVQPRSLSRARVTGRRRGPARFCQLLEVSP